MFAEVSLHIPCTSRASLWMLGNAFVSREEHLDERGAQDQGRHP